MTLRRCAPKVISCTASSVPSTILGKKIITQNMDFGVMHTWIVFLDIPESQVSSLGLILRVNAAP